MVLLCGGESPFETDVFLVEVATVSCINGEGSPTIIKGSDLSDKGEAGSSSEDAVLRPACEKDATSTSMDRSMSSSVNIRLIFSSVASVGVLSLPSVNDSSRLCDRARYLSLPYGSATKRLASRFSEALEVPDKHRSGLEPRAVEGGEDRNGCGGGVRGAAPRSSRVSAGMKTCGSGWMMGISAGTNTCWMPAGSSGMNVCGDAIASSVKKYAGSDGACARIGATTGAA